MDKKLRFNKNGKFVILQIADTQERVKPSPDTLRLIECALDKVNPDLAIFTGDQLKGYAFAFMHGNKAQKVKTAIDAQIAPLVRRNIPFAATFGNHDAQAGLNEKEQFEIYKSYPNSVCLDNDKGLCGEGTFHLPVYASDSDRMKFNLYIINSYGLTDQIGKYSSVTPEQLAWFQSKRDALKQENGGNYVPSLLFQHIPVEEIGCLLKPVHKKTKGAVEGYRHFKGKHYIVDDDLCFENKLFKESPGSPDENTHEFDIVREKGDVLGMYFGHDHRNNFAGRYKNIDLGYAPSCGFHVYGPRTDRAVRVFELDENNPLVYKTYTLTYKDLCGDKPIDKITDLFYHLAPANLTDVKRIVKKVLLTLCGLGIAALLIKLLFF